MFDSPEAVHNATPSRAAYPGGNTTSGISAIGEFAHKIVAIRALTELGNGITQNVGLVSGGQLVNTTAPYAEGQIDLRCIDPADRDLTVAPRYGQHEVMWGRLVRVGCTK